MGPPKFFDASLHACHALMTPAGLRNLTFAIPLRGLLDYVPDGRLHLYLPFGAVPDLREVRTPLRPTWFPVYASDLSFGSSTSTLLLRICNTRYGWLVRPYPAGTRTLQEAPSLSWRTRSSCSTERRSRPPSTSRKPSSSAWRQVSSTVAVLLN